MSDAPKSGSPDASGDPAGETLLYKPGSGPVPAAHARTDATLVSALATLPGYEIQNKLGEGGMGAVYKARQRTLNRTVAVKVLPQRWSSNEAYVARLKREAQVLARINHAHVIACYDLGEHQGMLYVVMEFVEGESLAGLLERRKTLPADEALFYIKQAVMGLDHAWAVGIVHRDIKPENLLLAKAPPAGTTQKLPRGYTVKIADLGLAALTGEERENTRLTIEGTTVGSPHFMSPEQALGERELDFRTDIYALGITLYHMVTGKLPFDAPTVGAILAKKLSETCPDPRAAQPDLNPRVALLIQKMTARGRNDRYATYGDLLHDIEALEQGQEMLAQPLAPGAESMALAPDTLKALASKGMRVKITAVGAGQPGAGAAKSKGALFGALAGVALLALVLVGFLSRPAPDTNSGPAPQVTAPSQVKPIPKADPPANPDPEKPGSKEPAPAFTSYSLIVNHSVEGWTVAKEFKKGEFEYNEGGLYLNSIEGWKAAECALPTNSYLLVAQLESPGADRCEVQIGCNTETYLAFGLSVPQDAAKSFVYFERRNAKDHTVLEKLTEPQKFKPDNPQTFRIRFYLNVATCKVESVLLGAPRLKEAEAASAMVRIAVEKGTARFNVLEASPIPGAK